MSKNSVCKTYWLLCAKEDFSDAQGLKKYPFFSSKIGFPNENTFNSTNFEAIMPILFLNCQKYPSTTIYCLRKIIQERTSQEPCQKGLRIAMIHCKSERTSMGSNEYSSVLLGNNESYSLRVASILMGTDSSILVLIRPYG